jgi:hypothetical protein
MEWWHHKEKPLRQQLTEAIAECAGQIQLLRASHRPIGPYGRTGGGDKSREIALMELEYRRLTEALRDLGPKYLSTRSASPWIAGTSPATTF